MAHSVACGAALDTTGGKLVLVSATSSRVCFQPPLSSSYDLLHRSKRCACRPAGHSTVMSVSQPLLPGVLSHVISQTVHIAKPNRPALAEPIASTALIHLCSACILHSVPTVRAQLMPGIPVLQRARLFCYGVQSDRLNDVESLNAALMMVSLLVNRVESTESNKLHQGLTGDC